MTLAVAPLPASLPLTLPEHRDVYYGGAWHAPKSGRDADTINPGTGESLGRVADARRGGRRCGGRGGESRRSPNGATCCRSSAPDAAARSPRSCASTREELAMIDAADCGNPVAEMVERRDGRLRRRSSSSPASSPR